MARLGGLFRRGSPAAQPAARAADQVRAWAAAILEVPADTVIKANEIACLDPGCPGIETIILVLKPGERTRAYRIAKPLDDTTEQDVRDALV